MTTTIEYNQQNKPYKYSKQQLLALKSSPLVSSPDSLPLLSKWFNQNSLSNEYIRPKASHSTPTQRIDMGKHSSTTFLTHRNNSTKTNTKMEKKETYLYDDDEVPEWMNDSPPELSKDEQSNKMVFDSSNLELWKLHMKQMENKSSNKKVDVESLVALETLELSDNDTDDHNYYSNSNNNNNSNSDMMKDERLKEHKEIREQYEELGSLKQIDVNDLFHSNSSSHHSSPDGSSISTLRSSSEFLTSLSSSSFNNNNNDNNNNHEENIKLFDQLVSNQFNHMNFNDRHIFKEPINGMDMNNYFNKSPTNIPSMISHGQSLRAPPGFMIPSTYEQQQQQQQSSMLPPSVRDDLHFMPSTIPIRHPPVLSPSMSTGTSFVSYRRPIIDQQQPSSFLSSPPMNNQHLHNNNNNNNSNNESNGNDNNIMLPPHPMYHHPIPPPLPYYHHQQDPSHHPMMMVPLPPHPFNNAFIPPIPLPPHFHQQQQQQQQQHQYHPYPLINNHYMKGDT